MREIILLFSIQKIISRKRGETDTSPTRKRGNSARHRKKWRYFLSHMEHPRLRVGLVLPYLEVRGSQDNNLKNAALPIPAGPGMNTMAHKTSKILPKVTKKATPKRATAKPTKLLSGGNPQIAKAYGDAPVQAYIAAMPGWKREVGKRLEALIVAAVPGVYKAVKWNTPFYGIEGEGWFLGFHCLTKYIKVAFFRGTSLRPVPPVESKQKDVRYFHIHEGDQLDETQFAAWVKQAGQLPGERM
jgi:hypothetical protein